MRSVQARGCLTETRDADLNKFALLLGLFISSTSVAMAQQGDVEAGKQKSQVCAACHGPNGVSPSDMYPNLAGQHPKYIYKQLMDFKTASETGGEQGRNNVSDGPGANLSEQDMKDLALVAAQDPHRCFRGLS